MFSNAADLVTLSASLSEALRPLRFAAPVTHVYDPLQYAWAPHRAYLERYGNGSKEAIFLGMNPGPFGMAQTGVPFGEVQMVRDWMKIEAPVGRPEVENPARPVEGFGCTRSEVSGARLWGWAKARFLTPENFFQRFLVINYCPLVFMEESGKNRTPDKLPAAERDALFLRCDAALSRALQILSPKILIGVGAFAEERLRQAAPGARVARILHPSPASPAANKGWAESVDKTLAELGLRSS